jgi:hypothetical protein
MGILVNTSTIGLWREILLEAQARCSTHLHADLESYLVFLLMRFSLKPEIAHQIMATEFLAGAQANFKMQQTTFQQVGDKCLIFSGLFPGIADKRLVKISYFINLGKTAYATISTKENDIFQSLADHFVLMMDVLQSIRLYSRDYPDLLPLAAYDLWKETGSHRALNVLKGYTSGHTQTRSVYKSK